MPIPQVEAEQAAYLCSRCEGKSEVVNSRKEKGQLYRRRACRRCDHRWSTLELSFDQLTLLNENAKVLRDLTLMLLEARPRGKGIQLPYETDQL